MKKRINENTKITLTIKQLKRLVKEAKQPRIAPDCYAVNFRSMHTAIHGLFTGTKEEMSQVMAILDEMEKVKTNDEYEMLLERLDEFNVIEEIDWRDIDEDTLTYRRFGKTYKILNRGWYDIYC